MTDRPNSPPNEPQSGQQSLSIVADSADLLKVRVRPAQFARLMGVSKQTVSKWISGGKIPVSPLDGRVDVQAAVQQVLRFTEPGRLRARVLRQAVDDVAELRANLARADDRAERAEADLKNARVEIQRLNREIADEGRGIDMLLELIVMNADELRDTATDEWMEYLVDLDMIAIKIVAGKVDLLEYKREALNPEGGGGDAA